MGAAGILPATSTIIALPGREAIPVAAVGAPEGATAPNEGMDILSRRYLPFPLEAWVSPLPRGCPRPESLLPESPVEKLPFRRRGTNRCGVAPVKIRLEPGPPFRKPRNGPPALGETCGPGNTGSALGYIPPPGGDRPVKAVFSRNSSRRRSRPRYQAFHQSGRSRPSVQPPDPFPNQLKKPGGASPLDPVTDPILPCTGEMITLPDQYRKSKIK
jgi:hypothetical protein